MSLIINDSPEALLSDEDLAVWRSIPTAVISDELNRSCTMAGAIKPIAEGMTFAGQALTVQCMVGDNAPIILPTNPKIVLKILNTELKTFQNILLGPNILTKNLPIGANNLPILARVLKIKLFLPKTA